MNARISETNARIDTLASETRRLWGLELTEIEGDRFVVLPAGTLSNPPWTVGGRPALKLSSE